MPVTFAAHSTDLSPVFWSPERHWKSVYTAAEETGLHIKNLKYFGSQPWPYPSGIMIGFTADYESGEIKLQAEELNAGAFYTKDNLPEIPGKLSLARKLIDDWLGENSQTDLG